MTIKRKFSAFNMPDLPIFQVSGRTEDERGRFIEQLMGVLERRSISSVFIKAEKYRNTYAVQSLVKQYDLVMVDSGKELSVHQIRLGSHKESGQDDLVWHGGDESALSQFADRLMKEMDKLVRQTEVWGCILIGGKSSRMGRPKHLIEDENKITWLERTIKILRPLVDGLVVSGAGKLPEKLADTIRLQDVPGVAGPMTGFLAAGRWQPMVSWLFVACDMPHITTKAVQWLLADRRAGCWGRVPRLAESQRPEPLFAWYDFRAAQLFEEQSYTGNLRIGAVASHPKIETPVVPELLRGSWQNINTPDQVQGVSASAEES